MARTDVLEDVVLGLTLDRYQELMRLPEAAFNGLLKDDDDDCYDCNAVWKQTDRDAVAIAMARAEEMRTQELGYFPAPKYTVDEEYRFKMPLILDRKWLVAVGSEASSDIELAVVLDLGVETAPNDPVEIVVATTVTDADEICVYYPDENIRIHPSSVVISGGNVTIQIPRSRLVKPTVDTNCDPPPSYFENDNFLTTVDVKRCYLDPSDGAYFVWFGGSCLSPIYCPSTFDETTQAACPRIRSNRISIVELYAGTYSGSGWTPTVVSSVCRDPDYIKISYLSGRRASVQTEIETARLANSILPEIIPDRLDLCSGCWEGDQQKDPYDTITPYGYNVGAVSVWISDSRSKVGIGGMF